MSEKNKHSKKIAKRKVQQSKKKDEKEVKKQEKVITKKDKKMKKKHKKLRTVLKVLFILFLIVVIAVVAGVVAIFKTDKWAITEEQLLTDAGATIYDGAGNEIAVLTGDEINKKIELDAMGKIPDAFVSIEDERFYSHHGVDIKRTAHAIFSFATSMGDSSFGGSTITQQLVKITMKDDKKSGLAGVQRKIREWSRAVQVEKILSKDQILQRYLNRIYLGTSGGLEVRGVESASNYYFNKSAKDLTIAEAAFIAGMNHSPNSYNPFTETDISEKIKTRTKNVLGKMHELGKITDDEYNSAMEETNNGLAFSQGKVSNGKSELTYHTAAAINQIANELSDEKDISYNEARELVINSGYKIYTTVNTEIESQMEQVFENPKYIYKGTKGKAGEDSSGQSAMVIIEPSTGYVIGEFGGLGVDQNTLELNRGTSKRQGGSAFKPLVTIAPGLENKVITASTLFYDTKTTFGGSYTVSNDSNEYHNVTEMRTILTRSLNVPEVKLLSIMGTQKSTEFLSKIGIEANQDDAGLTMALGTIDVSPLEMAAGYAMIANGGTYITPTFYTKVEDKEGNLVIECHQEKTRVMSEENAYIEASLLEGPVKSGTASSFRYYLGNMAVAGKTGTTETAGDRWFCGFTPYYAAACWYGNDNNNGEFHNSACGGANPAGTVWFNVMKSVHANLAAKQFERPDGIVSVNICKATGKKATSNCKDTYTEIFAKSNIPAACDGHTTVEICKETGKLATEFCPEKESKSFGFVIDTEKNATWSPRMQTDKAPEETCDIHTEAQKNKVPNVVGMPQSEATEVLKNAGFEVSILKDNDKRKSKGVVLEQSATEAPAGATITITINQYEGEREITNTVSPENTAGGDIGNTIQGEIID